MKKFTTLLALLLTCIIGATAADFVPKASAKYLIKCKGNNNVVYYTSDNSILQAKQGVTEASYFTIESTTVENATYFYIHPAGDDSKYVYTAKTPSTDNNANDGVVGVTDTKNNATCLWKITFNYGNDKPCAFNITPKGYDNYSWNCRSKGIGYWHTGGNSQADNSWYITPNVELNGYYTIKNTAYKAKNDTRYTNLYNDFDVDKYTRAAQELPTSLTNNYVWHITTTDNNVLTVLNGQGTPLYHDGNASLPTLKVAYSDGTNYYFGEALNGGPLERGYKLTLWKGGDYNKYDNQWEFAQVNANNIYNVECNIEDGYVTYNSTGEKAKNHGFFLLSSEAQVADFTASKVGYYEPATVSIKGSTINVNYTYNLENIKQLAREALKKTGVGYPTTNAATRTALDNAVKTDDVTAIVTALNAFKRSTADIQMPEDGKAYRIKVPYINGTANYLYCNGNKVGNKASESTQANDQVFVCHIVNDKYMFATNHGTYLSWADSDDTTDKGYNNSAQTTNYIPQNDWTIEPATLDKGNNGVVSLTDRANVFGLVQMKALGKNGTTTYYLNSRINDAFVSQNSTDKYYDTGWNDQPRSCYYQFEEVEYPNTITFHKATNINGVNYIATFSAPFATIIPEGVKAYYVSAKENTKATMTAIDAQEAIPAKEGVILTSESGKAATMVPAASEIAATISANQLGNSAGANKALTAGDGFILGNGADGTAFYPCLEGSLPINKAYLRGNGGSGAIAMNFGNAVTGINTIAASANAKAPIFDLSGRRVAKATKGLYIQNGKKFIVK